MVADEKWYFTKEQLRKTPSIKCGIDADKELICRQRAAQFIQDLGQRLSNYCDLIFSSSLCINSAMVYMHRFYMFHSVTQFHRNAIASAAVFLSAKVTEQPRTLEEVINGGWMLRHRDHTPPEVTSTQYLGLLEDLVFHETVLLQTLGFDLVVDHPHPHIVKYFDLIKASKDHAEASYFMASNSLHLTTMCLLYKPTVVACFCIHITSEWSNWKIQQSTDGKPWFWHIDSSVTEQQLQQLTAEFLHIYDKCSTRLKQKVTSKLGNQSFSIRQNSLYSPVGAHSWRKQSCTNDGSTFRSSSVFLSKDPKKPSVSSSSSLFRPLDNYHENPEKKERERSEREKAGSIAIAPNASAPKSAHSHRAKQQASSSQPSSSSGKHPSGSGTKPKMHHDHRKAHRTAPKPEAPSLPSQKYSLSTSSSARESSHSRMSCDHNEANPVNLASRTSINHHGSRSKKARITIPDESEISVSSAEAALNIEKFYRNPEKHEKPNRRSYDPRNENLDHFGKDSIQKECEKYQQQQCKRHRVSNIDASAHNPTKPMINTNIRDEPSSTIGRSGSSSVTNKINHSEPMKPLEPEPMGRQTSLTNALKISKHEDLLSVATPDSGFGTQPTTNFRDCLSPTKTARSISALLQEPLVSMPSFLLGIADFGAPAMSSHHDEASSNKDFRAPRYSQVEHRNRTSIPFATAAEITEEKRLLPDSHEASGSSKASATTTAAETTSKRRKFDNYESKKKKKKKDKKHKADKPKKVSNMLSTKRNLTSQVPTRSQDKASSPTLAGLEMKIPMKRLRETALYPIQGSLKMEIRTLGDDTSSSMTRSYASSSSRNSDRSRTGSDASAATPPSNKQLRVRN